MGFFSKEHVRFHIQTLLGQREQNPALPLPKPASDEEKLNWKRDINLADLSVEVVGSEFFPPDPLDSHFPYEQEGGPGHKNATIQQLTIMRKMLLAVGILSFRPDFGVSMKSKDNKWLWHIAFEIFLKLVRCGEYPGVSLEPQNMKVISECFSVHVTDCLSRRYIKMLTLPTQTLKITI